VKTLECKIKNLVLCIKRLCPWRFGILGFKGKKKKRSLAMLKNLP
jgi:hypothetical protein